MNLQKKQIKVSFYLFYLLFIPIKNVPRFFPHLGLFLLYLLDSPFARVIDPDETSVSTRVWVKTDQRLAPHPKRRTPTHCEALSFFSFFGRPFWSAGKAFYHHARKTLSCVELLAIFFVWPAMFLPFSTLVLREAAVCFLEAVAPGVSLVFLGVGDSVRCN